MLEAPQHLRYGLALSRVAYEQKDYKRSIATSEELLKRSDLPAATQGELQLLQGKE